MVSCTYSTIQKLVFGKTDTNIIIVTLTIFYDQTSCSMESQINQKTYATNCHIDEMVFDKLLCTPLLYMTKDVCAFIPYCVTITTFEILQFYTLAILVFR